MNILPQVKEENRSIQIYDKVSTWANFSAFQEMRWGKVMQQCTPQLLTSSSWLAWAGRACMELDQMELAGINGGCHTRSGLY